jgi:hypothetical protein
MSYNPIAYEKNWQVSTAEKGTRYSVIRGDTGGDVACVPYGLTRDCKALATMISATPDLIAALQKMLELPDHDGTKETSVIRIETKRAARAALAKATLES